MLERIAFSQKVTHAVGSVFIVVFHQLLFALVTLQVVKVGAEGKRYLSFNNRATIRKNNIFANFPLNYR